MRTVFFEKQAFEDVKFWSSTNPKILKKVVEIISEIQKKPFEGIGKPEPLKHNLKGFWSRRLSDEHRIIYKVDNETVYIASCRYHYD